MQYNRVVNYLAIRPLSVLALLATMTVVTYGPAIQGAFQYDDFFAILINPHLSKWQTFVGHLDHMVRPVLYASFLFDRSLHGTTASGYHLLNVLLHLGSGFLVLMIVSRAVTEEAKYVPLLTAVLFLIHPIQTEAVTYISGRASGLMAFFYLLGLVLYIEAGIRRRDVVPQRTYVLGALLSFVLAMGSKETAMTFPFALLLWDGLIRRLDGAALRKAFFSNHLPFWLVLLAAALWAWRHPRYSVLAQFSLDIRPLWDNLLSQIHAVAYALLLFFCPWKQNFDHDLPVLHSLLEWPLPLDLLTLGGLIVIAVVLARRLPLVSFGIGWFFLQLLPTSVIPRSDLLSERNLYLASIGLVLAIVVLGLSAMQQGTSLVQRPRLVQIAVGTFTLAVVLTLSLMTIQRNALYSDPVLLWSDAVEKSPQKARPHNNLGHAYALTDNWDRAIEEYRVAAHLDPDYALARKNLRDAYLHVVGRD